MIKMVPRAGLEPARGRTSRDFKSLASTKFRHPGINQGVNVNLFIPSVNPYQLRFQVKVLALFGGEVEVQFVGKRWGNLD